MEPPHVHVAILGSGFSGLGAAIRLAGDGVDDLVVFERADDVGGTWRDNSYPGCACDVPSHLYSFSFAPNPRWTRTYSPAGEIWQYLRDCAELFGLMPRLRFGHEVLAAAWDDERRRWTIETSQGRWTADAFVSGSGFLSEPAVPDLPGLASFSGTTFHSARWNHGFDPAGRCVAVIGTGASAIQIVPELRKTAGRVTVFQRTPPWIVPRRDRPLRRWEHRMYGAFPPAQRVARAFVYWTRELLLRSFLQPVEGGRNERLARRHLEAQVTDPELRAKLTPDYRMGCKRILLSTDYYPALQAPNVELVTDRIAEIRPRGILTAGGVEHEADAIVFATGFRVTEPPIAERVRGRDGRTLAEVWGGSPQAHLGTTVSGFPNFFLLLGPNTGLGHTSVVYMIEAQIEHLRSALTALRANGHRTLEPRPEAQAAFVSEVDERMRTTVWMAGGCASWYIDRTGRIATLWPGRTRPFRKRVARFDPREYVLA
jgi:cation diffusion facilitator CzcD-associated flavoprotein CzcO